MKASRRAFLNSATAVAAIAAAAPTLKSGTAVAQGAPSPLELGTVAVSQITMVTKDAEKVARNFSEIFGPSWNFYEFRPKNIVLHDNPSSADCVLKLAVGVCGGVTFRLVQPVSGPSAYAEFLEKNGGEGYYSIGLGALRGYSAVVAALKQKGVGIEMQGEVGDGSTFTIFETAADLGCRVEICNTPTQESSPLLKHTGSFTPSQPSVFDMTVPVIAGGRRFAQVGIVVKDANKTAAKWEELLGLHGWRFMPIPISAGAYRGVALTEAELPSATVTQGGAYLGGMQIELLAPVEQKPGGVHRHFLDAHGDYNGFQHLMISPGTGGKEATLKKLAAKGIGAEWTATVHLGNITGSGDYIDLQKNMAGFLLEYNG